MDIMEERSNVEELQFTPQDGKNLYRSSAPNRNSQTVIDYSCADANEVSLLSGGTRQLETVELGLQSLMDVAAGDAVNEHVLPQPIPPPQQRTEDILLAPDEQTKYNGNEDRLEDFGTSSSEIQTVEAQHGDRGAKTTRPVPKNSTVIERKNMEPYYETNPKGDIGSDDDDDDKPRLLKLLPSIPGAYPMPDSAPPPGSKTGALTSDVELIVRAFEEVGNSDGKAGGGGSDDEATHEPTQEPFLAEVPRLEQDLNEARRRLYEIMSADPWEEPPPSSGSSVRRKRCVYMSFGVGWVLLAALFGTVLSTRGKPNSPITQAPSISMPPTLAPSIEPTMTPRVFANRSELIDAVDSCIDHSSPECDATLRLYGEDVNTWLVHNILDLSRVFSEKRNPWVRNFNQSIAGWDLGQAISMEGMFEGNKRFNQDLSAWNTSSAQDMSHMFEGASAFLGNGIERWDTARVTTMSRMFAEARRLDNNLTKWNVSSVESMNSMFREAQSFLGHGVGHWDVSSLSDMSHMFQGALQFNQDLSKWRTDSLQAMQFAFSGASAFNGCVTGWNTNQVRSMEGVFRMAIAFNRDDLDEWDTGRVESMRECFAGAEKFNGKVSTWVTRKVVHFTSMFAGATSFDQHLTNFDTSNAQNMRSMFDGASAFNGDVGGFKVGKVECFDRMFADAVMFDQASIRNWVPGRGNGFQSMFAGAARWDNDLCDWKHRFMGSNSMDRFINMFVNTSCPIQDNPDHDEPGKGPLCHKC